MTPQRDRHQERQCTSRNQSAFQSSARQKIAPTTAIPSRHLISSIPAPPNQSAPIASAYSARIS